jgi:radical SAM superfamily enzyme YgiQ (UPF0313 family)
MKVTLISIENSPSLIFPVMQEMLIQEGHECRYVHMAMEKMSDEILERITKQICALSGNEGLIGISCMTNTYPKAIKLIKKIRDFPKIKIILGGIHPTVQPAECLNYADYVCVGEGERALVDLVNKLSKNKNVARIKNIWTKKGNKIISNTQREILKDLDSLPVPRFNFEETYFVYDSKLNKLTKNTPLLKKFYLKYYYLLTSRGCPYRCKYCLNDVLINIHKDFKLIRRRSNNHILKELLNVKNFLPKNTIIGFVDDDFCAQNIENLKEFCKEYKEKIGLKFFCASTPSSMSEEKLICLLDAGMIRLEIGIQTISDKINKNIFGRYSNKEQVVKLVKILEKYRYRLQLCYDFILDNPWETDETRLETLEFILDIKKPFTASLFSLTTYPGTGLFERAKSEGLLKNDKEIYDKNHMILNNGKVNTLFVLYTKYGFRKNIIRLFISKLNNWPLKDLLEKSTYFLWRMYNYFYGLKDSLQRRDKALRDYYLLAPLKSVFKFLTSSG